MLVFLSAAAQPARAEDEADDDHDEARRAVEQGKARPLAEILSRIQPRLGGKVIGVELEREQGRYVYELKVVTSGGALREIYVDALTGEMLKSERK
ncbi:PepSY domain-containing protein [Taklimakanibacter lacteus]|uniref:PepSY domain-containing protein n=1 Tax=Taklimakanibacter lacteus TaxID=2268456 RepID=UPI0034D6BF03